MNDKIALVSCSGLSPLGLVVRAASVELALENENIVAACITEYSAQPNNCSAILDDANIVTITNHSNSDINCKFEFSSTNDNVQGNFSTDTINIASAEGYEYNADTLKATSTLSLSGTIKDATEAGTIGTASVTISASE